MITGIPDYRPPIEQGVRCVCKRYYVVFTGAGRIEAAEACARKRAAELHALFVDAREVPFMICDCGQILDFSPEYSEGMSNYARCVI